MKYQEFDGVRYCRDERTGYYLSSTHRKRMHVAVWEAHNGPIQEGYDVHHENLDKSDNRIDNLRCMERREHQRLHWRLGGEEKRARARKNMQKASKAAKAWHSSPEGRAWHRQHARDIAAITREPYTLACEACGKIFFSKKRSAKFCTNACKSRYRRKMGWDDVDRVCVECGRSFRANRFSRAVTCGKKCGARYRLRVKQSRGMI